MGTNEALPNLSKKIYSSLDNSIPVITFTDFAKAFETMNHNILLSKLYKYGIREISHNLLKN